MLLSSVWGKTIWDARRLLVGWAIGIAGYLLFTVSAWPAFSEDVGALDDLVGALPEAVVAAFGITDLTSGVGYVEAQVFTLFLPLFLLLFAAIVGTRAIASEEESGFLEVLLTHPVDRGRLLLERLAALLSLLAALAVLVFVVLAAADAAVGLDVGAGSLAAGVVSVWLFSALFGCLALGVGALTGRRGVVVAVVATVAVFGYVANNLAPLLGDVEWLRRLSPFYYYIGGDPLREGFDPAHAGVLLAASALVLAAGALRFQRRDLRV